MVKHEKPNYTLFYNTFNRSTFHEKEPSLPDIYCPTELMKYAKKNSLYNPLPV